MQHNETTGKGHTTNFDPRSTHANGHHEVTARCTDWRAIPGCCNLPKLCCEGAIYDGIIVTSIDYSGYWVIIDEYWNVGGNYFVFIKVRYLGRVS